MVLTLKLMDNLQQIECHQRICHLFFIFNLTCCKFVALKENTLTHFFQNQFSLWGDQDVTLRESIWAPPSKTKSLNFPLLLGITPTKTLGFPVPPLITDHILEIKKLCLIAFRQLVVYVFSKTIMTNMKKFIKNKSFNTKASSSTVSQNYLPKTSWETLGMGEKRIAANSQKFTHLPRQENPPS